MLRGWDRDQRIRFTDISRPGFDAEALGLSWQELMRRIHGRLPDGSLLVGVEVFRRLYAAVGFRRWVAVSRWPGISWLLHLAYEVFARHRLKLTGRCDVTCKPLATGVEVASASEATGLGRS